MESLDLLYREMIDYYKGDAGRIQHFVKVHSFAGLIGRLEELEADTQLVLEAAAYVHDIGIQPAEELYGSSEGKLQEKLGPKPARELLKRCGFSDAHAERIAYLVAHHHTYDNINGEDYQILVEADFLVNLYEGNSPKEAVKQAYEKIFRTKSGKEICRTMFNL
ncbi:MAG: HD domain-containing protein [Clostridium sp.]|nr:HD domain-containing protein [Clostridium sp.]